MLPNLNKRGRKKLRTFNFKEIIQAGNSLPGCPEHYFFAGLISKNYLTRIKFCFEIPKRFKKSVLVLNG